MVNTKEWKFPSHINDKGRIQTNTEHSYGTARIARSVLSSVGLGEIAFLTGLVHDCGKFTNEFSNYIFRAASGEKVKKGSVIHSFAGVSLLLHYFHTDDGEYSDVVAEILACAVGSHHGLFDCIDQDGGSGFSYRLGKQVQYDREAIQNFFDNCCTKEGLKEYWKKAVSELSPVLEKCLKIAKDGDNSETSFYVGLLTRLLTSALIDGDRTDTVQFMTGNSSLNYANSYDWTACLKRIRKHLSSFPTDTDIQKARRNLSEACEKAAALPSGIYRLDMPTGAGKTLSGLRYAAAHAAGFKKKRVIYIAPLLSIIDQNTKVIREAIQDNAAILEHHSNIVKEEFASEELEKYELLSENWNSPIIITTMVQFLNTLFGGQTTQVRRFSALCDSVILLDEVQSIPNKLLSLFNLAITFLSEICRATIVLCSATQPTFENKRIEHNLLIPPQSLLDEKLLQQYEGVFKRTRILDLGNMRIEEISDAAGRLLEENNSVLIVCNKKSEAESLFQACKCFDCKCFHLSASMCMQHRKDTLVEIEEALTAKEKVICVSTQVIEAGVDISFETVIRLAAGLDSLVQSAGRCNRHGNVEKRISDVYIVNASNESLGKLEDIKRAQDATLKLLAAFKKQPERFDDTLSGEKAVRYYYQALYGEFHKNYTEYTLKDGTTMYDLLSENDSFIPEEYDAPYCLRQAFKTAGYQFEVLDSNQISVIVHYGESNKLLKQLQQVDKLPLKEQGDLLEQLKPYAVAIYDYQKRKYDEWGALQYYMDDKVIVLTEDFYSDKTGLISRKEGKEECNILIL